MYYVLVSIMDQNYIWLYFRLAHRIDGMQAAVIPLSVNLDKILDKLNGTNKDKKIRRKDMENIFDDIVNGEAGIYSSLYVLSIF